MRIARFDSAHDNDPKSQDLSWTELVTLLTTFRYSSDKNGPAWGPYEIEGKRKNENVKSFCVLPLDLDHVTSGELLTLVSKLETARIAFVLHTTHSHGVDVCARVVLRPSRALTPREYPHFRETVCARFGISWDNRTKDLARLYYLPSAPPGATVVHASSEGEDLQVEEFLAIPITAPVKPAKLAPVIQINGSDTPAVSIDLLRKAIRNAQAKQPEAKAELLRRALAGEPLSEEGSRDDAIQSLVSIIAFNTPDETPNDAILEIIRESVRAMPGELPKSGDWLIEAASKLARAKDRALELRAERKQRADANRHVAMQESAQAARTEDLEPGEDPTDDYTPEQLQALAEEHGCADIEAFHKRWIIQKGEAFYVCVNGRYQSPLARGEMEVSLPRDLARSPCATERPTPSGETRKTTVRELLADYATVARKVVASLSLQRSYYDAATQTFYEACCPVRAIRPVHHPEIHQWLLYLGGKHSEKLLDWVACLPRLDRQACAILFDAVKGVGKNLFAMGLARLWTTGGPTELSRILETHNDSLATCPLIFCDEQLPPIKGITARLRTLIGSTSHTLRRMFMGPVPLQGAIRMIVAGNNDRLLETGDDLGLHDIEAVSQRILHIESDPKAAEYLISLGGPPVVNKWVTEDMIAAHALWLAQNRKVEEGSRFLVEGESSKVSNRLATISGVANSVCEFLVHYLDDSTTITSQSDAGNVQIGSDEYLVNVALLTDETQWESRVPSLKVPTVNRVGRALSNLSSHVVKLKVGDRRVQFHAVRVDTLLEWAERNGMGDVEAMRARIEAPNSVILKARKVRHGTN